MNQEIQRKLKTLERVFEGTTLKIKISLEAANLFSVYFISIMYLFSAYFISVIYRAL